MSVLDITFYDVVTGERIFDPLLVMNVPVQVRVTNMGLDVLTDLGLYAVAATNVGDVDNPADYPPETDYQDLLTWGTASHMGLSPQGGIRVSLPQNGGGTYNGYIRRDSGSKHSNRIGFADLSVGQSRTFTIELETPPGLGSVRRLFVNLVLE